MSETKVLPPKRGDQVSSSNRDGVFEVVFVNTLMQTANVRLVDGSGPVIPNIPWVDLKAHSKK